MYGAEACGKQNVEKGVIRTRNKVYRPPLPCTYKGMEISENLNDGMEWVFRDYSISLNQSKDPLPPNNDVVGFYVQSILAHLS